MSVRNTRCPRLHPGSSKQPRKSTRNSAQASKRFSINVLWRWSSLLTDWTFLKASGYKVALLLNFGAKQLEIKRIVYEKGCR